MRLSHPHATAALLLGLASTASALTCITVESRQHADTLDKATPVVVVTKSYPSAPARPDGMTTLALTIQIDTLSPARLLADLIRDRESHRDAFIGRIVGVRQQGSKGSDGLVVIGQSVDTVEVEVEAVLKGNQSLGTHRFIDTVPTWHNRFTQLVDRRMIWFRGSEGKVEPAWGRRLDGTVAPTGPCGGPISGHPILPDWRVTRGGLYEEFGVGVPLTTVLQAFNGVAIRRTAARTGANGERPAMLRGGGAPVVLFTGGIPGRSGSAMSVDGRRFPLSPIAR
jgi:hypothetical protein